MTLVVTAFVCGMYRADISMGDPLDALEHAAETALPDRRVAVLGDVHGNVGWIRMLARALPYLAPDVTTILQLGDWWMPPAEVDEALADTNITAIYVTNGNHEPWDKITPLLDQYPGEAVRISDITWILPRPARLTIGGRSVLALGGAASVDRESREEGRTWWPDETITDDHVATAVAGGRADLMLTHESPANNPVRAVRQVLRTNPHRFPRMALEASAASRARVSEVWDAVHPELLIHGHMHIAGGGQTDDGRRVASLGRDGHEWNLGILDVQNLRMATPSLAVLRGLANDQAPRLTRAQRINGAAEALHSGVLDGLKPTPRALRDAQDYVDGVRSLEEILEEVRRRHTRTRHDEP